MRHSRRPGREVPRDCGVGGMTTAGLELGRGSVLAKPPGWPIIDPAAFHGIAGEAVKLIAPETEADEVGLLAVLLTVAGAAIGSGPHALADGAPHPARLYTVLIGPTAGGRKGTVFAQVRRVMEVADPGFMATRVVGGFGSGESMVDAVRDGDDDDPGVSDKRLLDREGEFGRVLRVGNRDGSTLFPTLRDAWDGVRLQARSRARTSVATGASVALVGDITPDEVRTHLSASEIAAGLGNRLNLFVVRRSKLLSEGGNLDDSAVDELGVRLRGRLEQARRVGRIRRTAEARVLWATYYQELEERERPGLVGTLTARAPAQLLRMSVAYALLDGCREIDVEHLTAARALWDYSAASAEYTFGDALGDAIADALLAELRRVAPAGLDGTQQRDLFARHATGPDLDQARDLLETQGLAESVSVKTAGRPKRVTFATSATNATEASKAIDQDFREATEGALVAPGDRGRNNGDQRSRTAPHLSRSDVQTLGSLTSQGDTP
jgi:hypothetical protein